jgi:sterol desaturase/sphingolipid hydroxylase (fatty acid hydroxylase superfamily)
MEQIIAYFSTIPSAHRSLILVSGITIFWLIENQWPLFKLKYNKWQHAGINIFFTLTTIVINFLLAFILVKTSDWAVDHHFGLLAWLPEMPVLLYTFVGLLLMDFFGAYLIHWLEHRISWLWRFHLIHHTDTWIDTTSANRHHPGESVLRFIFTTLGVALVGCPMWMIFLYQTLSVVATQFNHANISLPGKLDLWLSYLIVSPDMHKVHHHYKLPYTDSNYGNIFSVWDRLLGTYMTLSKDKIKYGVDTHQKPEEHNKIQSLLLIPFQPKRSASASEEN